LRPARPRPRGRRRRANAYRSGALARERRACSRLARSRADRTGAGLSRPPRGDAAALEGGDLGPFQHDDRRLTRPAREEAKSMVSLVATAPADTPGSGLPPGQPRDFAHDIA